jgi:hypothetical protein
MHSTLLTTVEAYCVCNGCEESNMKAQCVFLSLGVVLGFVVASCDQKRPPATPSSRADGQAGTREAVCCSPAASSQAAPISKADEEADVMEAVFRYQFQHNASAIQRNAPAYFLLVEGEDPSEAFLARFRDHIPPVVKGSLFKEGEGLKLMVGKVRWTSPDTVEVGGGYYEGGLSSSGNIYYLKRDGGKWTVTKDWMFVIS